MLNSEDVGDSSSRKRDNGDKSADVERPLKKARFAWQIKGKYHLKEQEQPYAEDLLSSRQDSLPKTGDLSSEDSDSSEKTFDNCSDETLFSDKTIDSEMSNTAEQNLEILGDYLLKQDFNELETDPNDAHSVHPFNQLEYLSAATNAASLSMRCSNVPTSVSDRILNNQEVNSIPSIDGDQGSNLPTMVNKGASIEDQILARWQARQLAKGFVDNTINRVLDSWLIAPLPPSMEHNHHMALDVVDFLDNLPGSTSIENEGILMAISAHGLQNNLEVMRRLQQANNTFSSIRASDIGSTTYESVDSHDFEADRLSDYVAGNVQREKKKSQEINKSNPESDGSSFSTISSNVSSSDDDGDDVEDNSDGKLHRKTCVPSPWIIRNKVPKTRRSATGMDFMLPFPKYSVQDETSELQLSENNTEANEDDGDDTAEKVEEKGDDLSKSPLSETHQNDETDRSATSDNTVEPMYNDVHLDFMDAAISFAIQNKGLTSYGADYG